MPKTGRTGLWTDRGEGLAFCLILVAFHFPLLLPDVKVPSMLSPFVRPTYSALPMVKLIRSPVRLPFVICQLWFPELSAPENL